MSGLIYKGNFCIHRIETGKYHYYADIDAFPAFYEQEFESIQEVEFELRKHAQLHGFDIRLSNVDKDPQGIVRMRRFVCSCEGKKRSSTNGNVAGEFSWTTPAGSKPSCHSASSLLASVIMNKKNSRCGCPYFVVYKRRQCDTDPNRFVYKAHSLDTFHNHLREGDRILRETERLSNSVASVTERLSNTPQHFSDAVTRSADMKILYELLSDDSSDKGLEYILQCIYKLAQISPDHYRLINIDMKKYLRDATLTFATAASDGSSGHQQMNPMVEDLVFNKDSRIGGLDVHIGKPRMSVYSEENGLIHPFQQPNMEQAHHVSLIQSTGPSSSPHHGDNQIPYSLVNANKKPPYNTVDGDSSQMHQLPYQLYNRGSLTPSPSIAGHSSYFPSMLREATIDGASMEAAPIFVSHVHHDEHNDEALHSGLHQQHSSNSVFGMLPELLHWFNSVEGRGDRREDHDTLRDGLEQTLSDDVEHDLFHDFNNATSRMHAEPVFEGSLGHAHSDMPHHDSIPVQQSVTIPSTQSPSLGIEQSVKRMKR